MSRIKKQLSEKISAKYGVDENTVLQTMGPSEFADISTNISFIIAKKQKTSPQKIATEIAFMLSTDGIEAKATGPYINISLPDNIFTQLTTEPISIPQQKKKVIIEYPSINPNKPWHLGHLRNALLGEAICRMYEKTGAQVIRMNYINDAGLQIAEMLYYLLKNGYPSKLKPTKKFDEWIGEQYVKASQTAANHEEEVRQLLVAIETDEKMIRFCREVCEQVVEAQQQTANKFGIFHDVVVFDSDLITTVFHDIYSTLKKTGVVYKKEEGKLKGCLVAKVEFNGQTYEKVLCRSDGSPTYTGKDIVFHLWKLGAVKDDRLKFREDKINDKTTLISDSLNGTTTYQPDADVLVDVVGAEQKFPLAVVKAVVEQVVKQNLENRFIHLAYGHVRLSQGKFSGRKGTWIGYTADHLLNEAIKRVGEKASNIGCKDIEKIARAAITYAFLKPGNEKEIVFDWSRALSTEGDSGPYILYSVVRAKKILKNASNMTIKEGWSTFNPKEKKLILQLSIWDEILTTSLAHHSPNTLINYALNLATTFSAFYTKHSVLKGGEHTYKRLMITQKYVQTLKDVLDVLNIEVPNEM